MALTRKFLTALGIEADKVDSIIDAHTETVDALKKERDTFKADADKLPEVQKQLNEAKEAAKNSGDYAKLKKEFDDYKAEVAGKETLAKKTAALKEIAKDAGLSEAGIAKAIKYSDFSKIELDEKDGSVKGKDAVIKGLKEEWSEYIQTGGKSGADTPTPPEGKGSEGGKGESRAAQLYKQHYTALYGQPKDESKGDSK